MHISKFTKKWFHIWTSGIFSSDACIRIYRRSKEVLRRDGWTKGTYFSDDNKCCSLGARSRAQRELKIILDIAEAAMLDEFLSEAVQSYTKMPKNSGNKTNVIYYNDKIAENQKDIQKVFDKAIKLRITKLYVV